MTKEALLWAPLEGGKVACSLCAHRCVIAPGKSGVCAVRTNRDGRLATLVYGEVVAAHIDPIEKKPLYHVLAGSDALTFGMLGCDYHCGYCQNWVTSQMLRDPRSFGQIKLCFGLL